MKKDQQFIESLISAFPDRKTKECFSTSIIEIDFIQDNIKTEKSFFTKGKTDGFQIINKSKKTIHLFSFDGCFYLSNDEKRCDGIVFDDKQFCFFELKLNVSSRINKVRKNQFNEAIKKLEHCIDVIRNSIGISPYGLTPEAYVVMRDSKYPKNRATTSEKEVAFLENNKVQLFSRNKKVFL